ncbi:protein-disulfide isomerase [Nocardiopsis sp. CNR-923]|uniref:DsbA family oxidoreductase n=1 Tax=Nocardiopsis sp. CNR-923 TaxID=1904965 RepID=UPI000969FFA1|nr:DsbA family oxidoreductase [Nocardiopsis sp. CNR-923]OLT30449.1 protein-disulfide isomerase [Nocardiopsis sp. CNR-923]
MRVEIWTDINCPWCYVGKARFDKALDGFEHRDQVEVVHRSFELNPSHPRDEVVPVVPLIAGKYGITETQAAQAERRIAANAAAEGLEYRTEGRDAGNSFDMHRLLHLAAEHGRQGPLIDTLYRANFAERRSAFEGGDRLVELAVEAGLDAGEARSVLADPERYAAEVCADEREAAQLGATGVPFFVLDRAFAVSGAQPVETFGQALEQAWAHRSPLTVVDGSRRSEACGPDGCALPDRG